VGVDGCHACGFAATPWQRKGRRGEKMLNGVGREEGNYPSLILIKKGGSSTPTLRGI
jgi:hypothetical protein